MRRAGVRAAHHQRRAAGPRPRPAVGPRPRALGQPGGADRRDDQRQQPRGHPPHDRHPQVPTNSQIIYNTSVQMWHFTHLHLYINYNYISLIVYFL